MAIRTKLLSGRNINTDSDFSKYIETVSEPWVIEWFEVSSWNVWVWKAWVPCERTNWETIYSLVENFSDISLDTSWTGYVVITIPQNMIDDWSLINEDWTWVASVLVVNSLPEKNYLELAQISSWVITDKRNMIKKVWELNTAIESMNDMIADLDERVWRLEEAWAIDHLEFDWIVWEKYTANDMIFKQDTPKYENCILEKWCNIWDVAANTEIHIQRIANWVVSNKLKLKIKSVWNPTTNVKVEVRKWIRVDESSTEASWYWDWNNILASWSLAYSNFSSNYADVEFTLDNAINVDKWTLLDVVVYQDNSWSKIVSSSDYYAMPVHGYEYSEAFRFISVNWNSRVKTYFMPYCISDSFADNLICKKWNTLEINDNTTIYSKNSWWSASNSSRSFSYWTMNLTTWWTFTISLSWVHTFWADMNWERIISNSTNNNDSTVTASASKTLWIWDYNFVCWCSSSSTYWSSTVWTLSVVRTKIWLMKTWVDWKPVWVYNIWGIWYWNIFWLNWNDLYIWEEYDWPVTKWSQTLGNAIGYLKIWKYKIPYYW